MTRSVIFRPQAEAELLSAQRWYEEQRPGLGGEFAKSIDETVGRLSSNPLVFPCVRGETRRAVLRRFPYGVYFRILADNIIVIAVMHGRRHPGRWRQRAP